jgi:phage shock protein E
MEFIIKYKLIFIGVITGAIGGYLYYHFVGCASGSCSITSKPLNSTLYGAMMGGLLFSMFKKEETKAEEK